MSDLDKFREKIFNILDPNVDYTQEDFNKEFGNDFVIGNPDAFKTEFKFVNKSSNPNPEYATDGSSGFDLRANLETDDETKAAQITLYAGKRVIVPTGLFFEIPENFEIQVRSRSGLAAKNGVAVLNSPGTVDADYRGEVKVILINHGEEDFIINHGDRIAQGVIASTMSKNYVSLKQVSEISDDTQRAAGGLGSTGVK